MSSSCSGVSYLPPGCYAFWHNIRSAWRLATGQKLVLWARGSIERFDLSCRPSPNMTGPPDPLHFHEQAASTLTKGGTASALRTHWGGREQNMLRGVVDLVERCKSFSNRCVENCGSDEKVNLGICPFFCARSAQTGTGPVNLHVF